MDALSTAILNLYDGVYQIEFTHFREFCLQTAGKLISYDRAMWVTGIVATQTILSASVINIDLDLLMKYTLAGRTLAPARPGSRDPCLRAGLAG